MRLRKRALPVFAAAALLAPASLAAAAPARPQALGPPATACGVERWAVKTLMDPLAGHVRLLSAKTTVAKLRQLPVKRGPNNSRGPGTESLSYEVTARLVAAKIEEDSDIHLIVADPKTRGQMIVEFPHPDCALQAA